MQAGIPEFILKFLDGIQKSTRYSCIMVGYRNLSIYYGNIFQAGAYARLSNKFSKQCSVFQSVVTAILKKGQFLQSGENFLKNLMICSESQAAIRFLYCVVLTFVLVNEIRTFLTETSSRIALQMKWQMFEMNLQLSSYRQTQKVRLTIAHSFYMKIQSRWQQVDIFRTVSL